MDITGATRRVWDSILGKTNKATVTVTIFIVAALPSCRTPERVNPVLQRVSAQWDMCRSLSDEIGHRAGFVTPTKEDLEKGYDSNGSRGDPSMCDRMTHDSNLMFATWSDSAYAQRHGPGSPTYSNTTAITIDGRSATESHDSSQDCRLEFHLTNGQVVIMTSRSRPEATTPACDQLRDTATTLSPIMPR